MRTLVRLLYRAFGWSFVGETPTISRYVVVGAPHTSNWDFLAFLAATGHFHLPARYIGKHTLFRWPFGGVMRRLGGIPIHRNSGQGLVDEVVAEFARIETMALVVAPEGTRSRSDHWRSGFYRIAMAADVPVVCAFLDYPSRTVGLGTPFRLTGDVRSDMARIRDFYAGRVGRHPAKAAPVMLREELP